jgi:hypothetical protein
MDLLKALVEDWVRYRWRDSVALLLISGGFFVILHTQNAAALDSAKGIIGAGLIMLDPRAMKPGTSGGPNGNGKDVAPTSANPDAPPASPGTASVRATLSTSTKSPAPAGWPGLTPKPAKE